MGYYAPNVGVEVLLHEGEARLPGEHLGLDGRPGLVERLHDHLHGVGPTKGEETEGETYEDELVRPGDHLGPHHGPDGELEGGPKEGIGEGGSGREQEKGSDWHSTRVGGERK